MIFGINTTRDISPFISPLLGGALRDIQKTAAKETKHSWNLCQISLQIMLLRILISYIKKANTVVIVKHDKKHTKL